jgi:hypothetical protein
MVSCVLLSQQVCLGTTLLILQTRKASASGAEHTKYGRLGVHCPSSRGRPVTRKVHVWTGAPLSLATPINDLVPLTEVRLGGVHGCIKLPQSLNLDSLSSAVTINGQARV